MTVTPHIMPPCRRPSTWKGSHEKCGSTVLNVHVNGHAWCARCGAKYPLPDMPGSSADNLASSLVCTCVGVHVPSCKLFVQGYD